MLLERLDGCNFAVNKLGVVSCLATSFLTLVWLSTFGVNTTDAQLSERPPEPTTLVVTAVVLAGREVGPAVRPLVELFHGARREDYGYCNSRGEIVFQTQLPGMYRVRVSLLGFVTVRQEITITPGMRHRLHFELHSSESGEMGAPAVPGSPPPREVIEQIVKARQLRATGDSEGAIRYMEGAVELAPSFTSARMELGLSYWRAKRLDEARRSFEKVNELDPTVMGAYLGLGQVLSEMDRDPEAREILLKASRFYPDRAEPFFALAKMHADSGELNQAEEVATQALERDCSNVPHIHLLLAGIQAEKGDLAKELASVEAYLDVAPAGVDLSRLQKRSELLRAELSFKPSVEQYLAIFKSYQNGDRAEALDRLAELPRQAVYRAVEHLRDREDDQLLMAALMHTDAAMIQGGDASLHISRAASCLKRIDDDSRRKELDRKWRLAMAYYFQSDHKFLVSVPFLLELTKDYPEDLEVRLAYGSVCEAAGILHDPFRDHLEIAEEQYRWILASVPDHIEASLRLGHVLKLRGQNDEAVDLLQNVLSRSVDPVHLFVANLLLGDIHRAEGQLQTAIDFYKSALEIDRNCLVAAVAASHALHQARRLDESTDVLRELLHRSDQSEQDTWWLYLSGHSDRFESLLLELRREVFH